MKVHVDRESCEAQGTCVRSCPDIFELDDDDVLHIADGEVPEEHVARVRHAVSRCPKQALRMEE